MWGWPVMKIIPVTILFVALMTSAAPALEGQRDYNYAVECRAFSMLASGASDAKSLAALKLIDAAVEAEIAHGKTRDQADADIEYSRHEFEEGFGDQAVFDAKWQACLKTWSPS